MEYLKLKLKAWIVFIFSEKGYKWVILLIAVSAVILAAWDLSLPGLYYDETLFVNAALGAPTNSFIALKIANIPIFLMAYLGALKAWIYYLIFLVAPVNAWTIRFPAILFGIAGGLLLVASTKKLFGWRTALIAAPLILFDPSLLMHSRLDWGPTALMFLFRGLLIYGIALWWSNGRPTGIWISILAIILGVFDKLNFLWIVGAAVGAIILVFSSRCNRYIKSFPVNACFQFGLLAAIFAVGMTWAVMVTHQMDPIIQGWGSRLSYSLTLLNYTLVAGGPLNFVSGDGFRLGPLMWSAYIFITVVALVGIFRGYIRSISRQLVFVFVFVVFTVLAFMLTKTATGPHHAAVIACFPSFLLAPLIGNYFGTITSGKLLKTVKTFGIIAVITMSMAMIVSNIISIQAFKAPSNANWDPSIYDLAVFTNRHPDAQFITVDWGMGTQLIALSQGKAQLNDYWPSFMQMESARLVLTSLDYTKDTYFIYRLSEFQNFPETDDNFITVMETEKIPYEEALVLKSIDGRSMIEVLKVSAKN